MDGIATVSRVDAFFEFRPNNLTLLPANKYFDQLGGLIV
jgi:hypothetical protein